MRISVPVGLGFIAWGRFGGKARSVRHIDWENFADDDVGGSATQSWINSGHSRSRSSLLLRNYTAGIRLRNHHLLIIFDCSRELFDRFILTDPNRVTHVS